MTDDGRGFDTAMAAEGQGLRSLQRRASSLGGSLQVTSSPRDRNARDVHCPGALRRSLEAASPTEPACLPE